VASRLDRPGANISMNLCIHTHTHTHTHTHARTHTHIHTHTGTKGPWIKSCAEEGDAALPRDGGRDRGRAQSWPHPGSARMWVQGVGPRNAGWGCRVLGAAVFGCVLLDYPSGDACVYVCVLCVCCVCERERARERERERDCV